MHIFFHICIVQYIILPRPDIDVESSIHQACDMNTCYTSRRNDRSRLKQGRKCETNTSVTTMVLATCLDRLQVHHIVTQNSPSQIRITSQSQTIFTHEITCFQPLLDLNTYAWVLILIPHLMCRTSGYEGSLQVVLRSTYMAENKVPNSPQNATQNNLKGAYQFIISCDVYQDSHRYLNVIQAIIQHGFESYFNLVYVE